MEEIATMGYCSHCGKRQQHKSKSSASEWLNRHLGAWPCLEYRKYCHEQRMVNHRSGATMNYESKSESTVCGKRNSLMALHMNESVNANLQGTSTHPSETLSRVGEDSDQLDFYIDHQSDGGDHNFDDRTEDEAFTAASGLGVPPIHCPSPTEVDSGPVHHGLDVRHIQLQVYNEMNMDALTVQGRGSVLVDELNSSPWLATTTSLRSVKDRTVTELVRSFVNTRGLSRGGVTSLLRLIRVISDPQYADSARRLPINASTFIGQSRREVDSETKNWLPDDVESDSEPDVAMPSSIFREDLVLANGDITVTFPYVDIVANLTELLIDPKLASVAFSTEYIQRREVQAPFSQTYDEIYTGDWWRDAEHGLRSRVGNPKAKVLAVILYVDGVSVDFFGNVSMIPIMMTLGNFDLPTRNTFQAKRLLGFIPAISDEFISTRTKTQPQHVRRELMHAAFKVIMERLDEVHKIGGLKAYVQSIHRMECFYPMVPFIACDNKEAYVLANLKAGQTNRPCRICLRARSRINRYHWRKDSDSDGEDQETHVDEYRDYTRISKAILDNDTDFLKDNSCHHSFHSVFSAYPNIIGGYNQRQCRQHLLFPPDMLHTMLGGVMRYAVIWILEIMKKMDITNSRIAELHQHVMSFHHGQSSDGEFDFKIPGIGIAHIVKHSTSGSAIQARKRRKTKADALKSLGSDVVPNARKEHGTQSHTTRSATKFEMNRWPSVLFAILNVITTSQDKKFFPEKSEHGPALDIILVGGFLVMEMFFECISCTFRSTSLMKLEDEIIPKALQALYRIYCLNEAIADTNAEFSGIKLHLILHLPYFIRHFGLPTNWDTGTFESAHKGFVKYFYEHGSKHTTDVAYNTLKSQVMWRRLCQSNRVDGIRAYSGSVITSSGTTETGIRSHVRRWRTTTVANANEQHLHSQNMTMTIVYRFVTSGYLICWSDSNAYLTVNSKWSLQKLPVENDSNRILSLDFRSFKPHRLVVKYLTPLLQQYSRSPACDIPGLRNSFDAVGDVFRPLYLRYILHDSIAVDGQGYFAGYERFVIVANGKYGKDKKVRERYDVIEVTIPQSAGGAIAGSNELLRFTSETAPARVLGICTIERGTKDSCFLIVMFFRKGVAQGLRKTKKMLSVSQKRALRHFSKVGLDDIYYGLNEKEWIAVYPLTTMIAPVMCVPDTNFPDCSLLYNMRYLHRGTWQTTSTLMSESSITWDANLQIVRNNLSRRLQDSRFSCSDNEGTDDVWSDSES